MPDVPIPEPVIVYRPARLVITPLDLFLLAEDGSPLTTEGDVAILVETT